MSFHRIKGRDKEVISDTVHSLTLSGHSGDTAKLSR